MKDTGFVLRPCRIRGVTKKSSVVQRSHRFVSEEAGSARWFAIVSGTWYFDRLCRVVKVPLVAQVRARISFHFARNLHVFGPRDSEVACQAGLTRWSICMWHEMEWFSLELDRNPSWQTHIWCLSRHVDSHSGPRRWRRRMKCCLPWNDRHFARRGSD